MRREPQVLPKEAPEPERAPEFKAKPAPTFDAVFQPKRESKRTQPEPFAVAEIYEDPRVVRERLAAEQEARLREAAASFRAQPVASTDAYAAPHIEPKAPTLPEPFTLRSHVIGESMRARAIARVQAELEELEAKRRFHAAEASVLTSAPYIPAKSTKALTNVSNVELKSDVRSKKRAEFDKSIAAKAEELARLQAEADEARMAQEEAELLQLRKKLVHKVRLVLWWRVRGAGK